jgi:hypothetical protein
MRIRRRLKIYDARFQTTFID